MLPVYLFAQANKFKAGAPTVRPSCRVHELVRAAIEFHERVEMRAEWLRTRAKVTAARAYVQSELTIAPHSTELYAESARSGVAHQDGR